MPKIGPTCGFAASPEVGPGASVGTLKTGYGAWRASTRCHVSCSFRPHLPVEVGSSATTCPVAPDLTSLLRRAPALPCVPQQPCLLGKVSSGAATSPMASGSTFLRGELRCCHMSHCPCGLWTTGIKKCLAAPGMQLGSHVFKGCSAHLQGMQQAVY
jgi:hypothetical protein